MSKKSEKKKQIYDGGIIACLEDEPVFSYMPFDMEVESSKTFSQAMAPDIQVHKKIEDKRWTTPVDISIDGERKQVFYFARIEKGFPLFRVEEALRVLNDEINKWPEEDREKVYKTHMVDSFFEKLAIEFHYEKKNTETKAFDFIPWDRVSTGFGKKTTKVGLTDNASGSEMEMSGIAQKLLRPWSKKRLEETSREAAAILADDMAQKAVRKAAAEKEAAEALECAAKSSQENTALSVSDLAFMTHPNMNPCGAKIHPFPHSITASAMASVPGTSTTTTSRISPDNDKIINLPPMTSAATNVSMTTHDTLNCRFAAPKAEMTRQQTKFGDNPVIFSLGSDTQLLTQNFFQNFLRAELTSFLHQVESLVMNQCQEIKHEVDEKYKKLDKKIGTKCNFVHEMKKDTKLVGVPEQVTQNSPQKSLSCKIQTSGRGQYILQRLIPFNTMGKACDVFFSFRFVQEQLCELLTPHLRKMQLSGVNFTLAKTCVNTFFTPNARAHLIYGKNENSYKNLLFYKRPLPDGLHNMVDKLLVLIIEDLLNLAPYVHRDLITDIRSCCTTTFTTNRARFLQLAIDSFVTVAEAAQAVAEEDFRFYEANKHWLKRTSKNRTNVSSFGDHVQYLLNRQQFKEAKKLQDNCTFKQCNFPNGPHEVFDELKKLCVVEEDDIKEVIRRICAAAHCFNVDYTQLQFDKIPNVPELPNLYNQVLTEIDSNITELLAKYSSDLDPAC